MQLPTASFRSLVPSPTPALFTGALLLGLAAATGCTDTTSPQLSESRSASTVNDYGSTSGGCSTSVVIGLSAQIAQESACTDANGFVPFAAGNGITITSNAVLPYLVPDARDDLQKVAANNPVQVNSALRTIAQQYLLYHWYLQGRCGITAAAHVGNSNHEGGRAVDLANYGSRITAMSNHGWRHDVPGDVVHFDHTSSADVRGRDVEAFQRLWNANNPNDQISEDGSYGPQTEARLKKAPAGGFAIGPSCQQTGSHVATSTVDTVDGPDRVMSGTRAHYVFTLRNTGTVDWSDATQITVASGAASQLYDAASWTSPTVLGTLPAAVAVGAEVDVEFDVMAPAVTTETPISEPITLSDSGTQVAAFNLGVTVTMTDDGATSDDTTEADPAPQVSGGCAAGGGSGGLAWLALVVPALVLSRRRR